MWVVTGDAGGTPYPCEEDSARFLLAIVALFRRRVLEGCWFQQQQQQEQSWLPTLLPSLPLPSSPSLPRCELHSLWCPIPCLGVAQSVVAAERVFVHMNLASRQSFCDVFVVYVDTSSWFCWFLWGTGVVQLCGCSPMLFWLEWDLCFCRLSYLDVAVFLSCIFGSNVATRE